ncbi:MAG: hypothetical protein R2873_04995 [Caldilineaceae bacterium]
MPQDDVSYQIFNLETMSGVYPGSRTAVMQRIRLLPLAAEDRAVQWARLLWYDDPPACVLFLQGGATEQWEAHPLLRIEDPLARDFAQAFHDALTAAGWRAFTCGDCAHWQPLINADSLDALPLGRCGWGNVSSDTVEMPESLREQSVLALGCPSWTASTAAQPAVARVSPVEDRAPTPPPVSPWQALKIRLGWERPEVPKPSWGQRVVERSGVGAGTEPCFACQGRIANLGALTVATDEDDKRTFSVWRCRRCHTFYLNDWTDRWERLDSLETEEIYYRLTPVEAVELLALFDNVIGGEHPAGRRDRMEQRHWLEKFTENRPRVSHQIRQGR